MKRRRQNKRKRPARASHKQIKGFGHTVKIESAHPLPQFRLETDDERRALARISCNIGRKRRENFETELLAYLARIAERVQLAEIVQTLNRLHPDRSKLAPSEAIRAVNRRAQKIERFIKELERPLVQVPVLLIAQPPIQELVAYAKALRKAAAHVTRIPKGYTGITRRLPAMRRGRRPKLESALLVEISQFVRTQTGKPHRAALAILLRRPLRENVNTRVLAERLRNLETEYRPQPNPGRHACGPVRIANNPPSEAELLESLGIDLSLWHRAKA